MCTPSKLSGTQSWKARSGQQHADGTAHCRINDKVHDIDSSMEAPCNAGLHHASAACRSRATAGTPAHPCCRPACRASSESGPQTSMSGCSRQRRAAKHTPLNPFLAHHTSYTANTSTSHTCAPRPWDIGKHSSARQSAESNEGHGIHTDAHPLQARSTFRRPTALICAKRRHHAACCSKASLCKSQNHNTALHCLLLACCTKLVFMQAM